MTELSRRPEQSTQKLRELDGYFERESAAIMASETLTPTAKRARLQELRSEYTDKWTLAHHEAEQDLAEWREIFQSRAEYRRRIPKLPNHPIVYDPPDRGAPLPEIDWDNRWVFVKIGEQANGWPIVEAQPKPQPPGEAA